LAAFLGIKGVGSLTNTGHPNDLNFILGHVDDMDDAFSLQNSEIMLQQYHDQFEDQDSRVPL